MSRPEDPRPQAYGDPLPPTIEARPAPKKRNWKRLVLELLLWTALAVATALFLVYASERWLPANF